MQLQVRHDDVISDVFISTLEQGANVSDACRAVGLSRVAMYTRRERCPVLADRWERAISRASRERAVRLLTMADEHMAGQLDMGWEYVTDPVTGDPVLDDDFEPVRRSNIAPRDLAAMRREARSTLDGPDGGTQNNIQISLDTPRTVSGPVLDVEAILAEYANVDGDDE